MKIEESLRRKQIKREFSPPVEWRVTKFLAIPSHTPPMCGDSDDMTVLNDFKFEIRLKVTLKLFKTVKQFEV